MDDHRVGAEGLAGGQLHLDLHQLPQRRCLVHTQRQAVKTHVGYGSRQGLLADLEDRSGFHWKPSVTAPFVHRVPETSARSELSAYLKVRSQPSEKKPPAMNGLHSTASNPRLRSGPIGSNRKARRPRRFSGDPAGSIGPHLSYQAHPQFPAIGYTIRAAHSLR
jgi:hypothetical protein